MRCQRLWPFSIVALTLLAVVPGHAQAASFSGPTNFAAGATPRWVAVGDFNGDADPDLAVANHGTNNVSILLGAAGGSFTGRPMLITPAQASTGWPSCEER